MRSDLVIVGGGPIGCMTAAYLSPGHDVVILEEHQKAGVPVQCAGLVAPRVIEMTGATSTVLNDIDSLHLVFPDGRDLYVNGNETKAIVMDRGQFDEHCRDRAVDNGAKYLAGNRFFQASRTGDGLVLGTQGGDGPMNTKLAIGADGYHSSLGRSLNMPLAREFVRGVQVDIPGRLDDEHAVRVWIGNDIAPGFFAWQIPCGDFSRLGLGVSAVAQPPNHYLKRLLKVLGHDDSGKLRTYSGMIPIGTPVRTYADNVILVGDAAGHVKPLSGGGLYTGLTAAKIAAEVASKALDTSDCSASRLKEYERGWRKSIGKELSRAYWVRKAFVRMSDEDLNEAGRLMDRQEVRSVLAKGDIDNPTEIAGELLRHAPGLVRFSPQLLASLIMGG